MYKCNFSVSLVLQAPVLTHTSDTFEFGFDMATRKYQNKPVLNGSLIRGNILHSLRYFSETLASENTDNALTQSDIQQWFGKESSGSVAPNRAKLNFDYFWKLDADSISTQANNELTDDYNARYRIGINEQTGTVETGNFQVIESVFKTGDEPRFSGEISLWVNDEAEEKKFEFWLNKSLQYVAALGALKGVGFGKVLKSAVVKLAAEKVSPVKLSADANRIELTFSLDRPLCVAQPHTPNSNRFVSEDYISGSVLKGAFSRQFSALKNAQALTDELDFENIKFTHALPIETAESGRPLAMPLSLSLVDGELIDMALQTDYCLLFKKPEGQQDTQCFAPAFSTDWKPIEHNRVTEQLKNQGFNVSSSTQRLLTVRTAIDKATGTAEESKLFSLECIDNNISDQHDSYSSQLWRAEISLENVNTSKKQAIAHSLCEMLTQVGLSDIGKTKANARVSIKQSNNESQQNENQNSESHLEPVNDDCYIVMLRSGARMLPATHDISPTNGQQQLQQRYAEYFNYISNGELTLSHSYSQQHLYGGDFYWKHFRNESKNYRPEWLSEAGSVFVLKAVNKEQGKVKVMLQRWLKNGLPVAEDRKDDNWQTDPLIPQNGYGEIVINHPIHTALATPEEGELK